MLEYLGNLAARRKDANCLIAYLLLGGLMLTLTVVAINVDLLPPIPSRSPLLSLVASRSKKRCPATCTAMILTTSPPRPSAIGIAPWAAARCMGRASLPNLNQRARRPRQEAAKGQGLIGSSFFDCWRGRWLRQAPALPRGTRACRYHDSFASRSNCSGHAWQ